jgi:cell division initiation protein
MADFDTAEFRAARATRFARSATEQIADRTFPVVMRGYDRAAVDAFVQEVVELITELEGVRSQEAVVQRALEEVGEETAGILQRAHETADEIAARSRAQAEGRLQRAEREAELIRQQADAYSEKIVVDTRLLWDERQRLIEDIRQLADDVLSTAEEAQERVSMPTMIDEDGPETDATDPSTDAAPPAEQPTSEVELDVLPGGADEQEEEPERT